MPAVESTYPDVRLDSIGKRWTTDTFGLDPSPVPVSGCTSPAYFEQELERLFKRAWLPVGRETELPAPRSYFVHRIDALKTQIILVRDNDGQIRAFHNVCTHRCNRLIANERGTTSRFRCQYHGWVFGLNGGLIGVPDESQFFDLDKGEHGLTPVAVETWNGFIFVNLDAAPSQSLRDYMGEIHDGLDGYPFGEFTRCIAWKATVNCNWKLIRDAFSELYHIPFLHDQSSAFGFVSKEQPFTRALAFALFEHGGQYSIYGNPAAKYPPMATLAFRYGTAIIKSCETFEKPVQQPPLFNPSKSENWSGEIVQLFPSLQLSLFPQSYLYHYFMPLTVDTAVWEMRLYMAEPTTFSERFAQEYAAVQVRDGVLEDLTSTEGTQSVLASGARKHFVFSDQELLVRANHLLNQRMAGPYPGASDGKGN